MSQIVETFALAPNFTRCRNLQNFPVVTQGSVGCVLPKSRQPIVCGGSIEDGIGNQCYIFYLSSWRATFSMNENRTFFVGMVGSPYQNSSHKMFVLGGGQSLNAEVLTGSGWEVIGPPIPSSFYLSCLIVLNETSIFLIGGGENNIFSNETYIFNSEMSRDQYYKTIIAVIELP